MSYFMGGDCEPESKTLEVTYKVLGARCPKCDTGIATEDRPTLERFIQTHLTVCGNLEYDVEVVTPAEFAGRRHTIQFGK